jgi:hypothetical protein
MKGNRHHMICHSFFMRFRIYDRAICMIAMTHIIKKMLVGHSSFTYILMFKAIPTSRNVIPKYRSIKFFRFTITLHFSNSTHQLGQVFQHCLTRSGDYVLVFLQSAGFVVNLITSNSMSKSLKTIPPLRGGLALGLNRLIIKNIKP